MLSDILNTDKLSSLQTKIKPTKYNLGFAESEDNTISTSYKNIWYETLGSSLEQRKYN